MNSYFLTGATGVLGSAIVPMLLEAPDTSVDLLLRAKSESALEERLRKLFDFWGLKHDQRSRVRALRGDATQPHFGLDPAECRSLAENTTQIIHCAASVRMNLPLDEARRSAVGSTLEILAFTRSARHLQKVEFVSTVGVAGRRAGTLPETWIDDSRSFHNTYEQSKAEAEELVRHAVEREGLPITLHRPSMVIGDSLTGCVYRHQIFYFICEFLSGRKTIGLYPDLGDTRLDVIPVDWVAEAIVASSQDTETTGRIFNLCSGPRESPLLTDLKKLVRSSFRSQGLWVPPSVTLPRLAFAMLPRIAATVLPERKRGAMETIPIYLDYLVDGQGFDNHQYRATLRRRGIHQARVSSVLPTVINEYLQVRQRRPRAMLEADDRGHKRLLSFLSRPWRIS